MFLLFQANVVLKERETFIEYLQKQLNEAKGKLDSEVSWSCFYAVIAKCTTQPLKTMTITRRPDWTPTYKVRFLTEY